MEIAGFILSIIAICFSAFVYLKHDKKIKIQTKILNQFEIDKISREKTDTQKANLIANVIVGDRGSRTIVIENTGMCIARNTNIEFDENTHFILNNNPFPVDIEPHQKINIKVVLSCGSPEVTIGKVKWADLYQTKNEKDLQIIF